ncbi:hypothetical protein ACLMJK_001571 [Lecanora helva]
MELDPLSIIAPARVKVLLVPVGRVKQSRFTGFVQRLQSVNVVRLGDVSPDNRPHRKATFSPLAFPEGYILYDLSTSLPPSSHSALAPLELYQEILVVVGLADGNNARLDSGHHERERGEQTDGDDDVSRQSQVRLLVQALETMIDDFPNALVHQLLIFDHEEISLPERIYTVPAPSKSRTTTIKTIMCDLTSRLLAEMATYAKSLQSLHSLDTPRAVNNNGVSANNAGSALPSYISGSANNGSPRPFSPVDDRLKSEKRTTSPAKLPSNLASGDLTPRSRPSSPPNDMRAPPVSFNEGTGPARVATPSQVTNHDRAASRDRMSAAGLSSSVIGERERSRGKGRIGIVIGAMYLLAGRWPDAVKELVQNAATARNNSDYVWHAKAMDYVMVCLLMYAWAGMDFRIPENLFPGTEKPGSSSSKSSKQTNINTLPDTTVSKSTDPETRAASLRNLTSLLPDLASNILNLYARAWTFTDDKLLSLVFSQTAIRYAKLLGAIHRSNSTLDDGALRHIVLNTDLESNRDEAIGTSSYSTKGDIVELLFRGYPELPKEISINAADRTMILAGIASVLSDLGYHRKRALVLKELLMGLLPALVQARKDGAAEMGVHPAASLASLNATVNAFSPENSEGLHDGNEQGMRSFLSYVCQSYGVVPFGFTNEVLVNGSAKTTNKGSEQVPDTDQARIVEAIASRALLQASAKAFGSQELKLDILRSCINVCETLPDLGGALQYSAELLRIGGSGIAPSSDSSDGSPDLGVEEQVRLVNNISRTLSAARQLGIEHPESEYWDDFLVRGIDAINLKSSKTLQSHSKTEMKLATTTTAQARNPFIYNPFLKNRSSVSEEFPLVAMEESLFRVTLQNLYDFDIAVERVALLADGLPFESEPQSTIIGPYRTQTIHLSGRALSRGTLTIHGCSAKIRGCRERKFPTVKEPWALKSDVKGRYLDLARKKHSNARNPDTAKNKTVPSRSGPHLAKLTLDVLGAQPAVILKSVSAPQAAIMLLVGQSKRITVTLQNASSTSTADLLLVSFDDSVVSRRQSALSSQDFSAVELYELELASTHKQSLKWVRDDKDKDPIIDPGKKIDLEIEISGLSDLSNSTIQVDYAHLGIPKEDIKDKFYTRQLVIPLTITVNASIELKDLDILALPDSFPSKQQPWLDQSTAEANDGTKSLQTSPTINHESLLNHTDTPTSSQPRCLLLLDFHNYWSSALTLTIEISDPPSASTPNVHTRRIASGTTERIPITLARIYLSNPYAQIPSINPANKRQFVVSATKHSAEAERTMRESFWYREALLSCLSARWKDESTGRNGEVDLRSLKLSSHMLAALKLPDVDIKMSVTSAESSSPSSTLLSEAEPVDVSKIGPSEYMVPISTFLTLKTDIYNRSSTPIPPLLRLQPTLANQPQNIALDLNKKLLVNGLLQRVLPALEPSERRTVETTFLVLSYGKYEWTASVEEIVPAAAAQRQKEGGRARAATGELDVLSDVGRRIWVAEDPCVVIARDASITTDSSRDTES